MQLRITIAMCMVEIRNRKTLLSKVNIILCKSDVKIGDYADSLNMTKHCKDSHTLHINNGSKSNTNSQLQSQFSPRI